MMPEPAAALFTAPRLIAITDLTRFSEAELLKRAATLTAAARAGSVAVLLREHQASARRRLTLGRELRAITRAAEQQLWLADRLDLALVLQADAAHLGEGSVTGSDARRLLGADLGLSRAWHRQDVDSAELSPVNAVLLSPIFDARKGRPALGVAALTALNGALAAASSAARPFALGGVTASNARACLAAGAWGVAAMGAAWTDDAVELLSALGIRR